MNIKLGYPNFIHKSNDILRCCAIAFGSGTSYEVRAAHNIAVSGFLFLGGLMKKGALEKLNVSDVQFAKLIDSVCSEIQLKNFMQIFRVYTA